MDWTTVLWWILGIVAALAVVIVLWVAATYNRFVTLRSSAKEAYATMDVFLKKRYDLIPNLVETVRATAAFETETLEKVIAARNMAVSAATVTDKMNAEKGLTGVLRSLFAVAEAYPDLKASASFLSLQGDLRAVEQDISNARRYYNATVREYNVYGERVPSNIVASLFKFRPMLMFEADEQERENVKVDFTK